MIFALGCVAFGTGRRRVIFAKIMNVFSKDKVNPSSAPPACRRSRLGARRPHGGPAETDQLLLQHAWPERRRVIGSAIAAGVFLGLF